MVAFVLAAGLTAPARVCAQAAPLDWQRQVRSYSQAQNWTAALQVLDGMLESHPRDEDARAWRARVLLWSGDAKDAEAEFRELTTDSPRDPDMWEGLASAYERRQDWNDALDAIDHAVSLDGHRADLHAERGRILAAANRKQEAKGEFRQALVADPTSAEAKAGLASLAPPPTQELRVGTDNDLFNFTSSYQGEWLSLTSSWSPRWTTSVAGDFYQRGGPNAGKFVGSATLKSQRFGGMTAGGAVGHDNGIIPRSETFFSFDRGWRISEDRTLRGVEATYEQHWYWYSTARVVTLTGGALIYLPRDWTWSINATGARNSFPGLPVGWQPSGMSRLNFPLVHREERALSGNVFFATGSEDFALVEQIGSFASQTYGGGFRLQFNAREDVTGYASFQQRTQNRTDTTFGFSYGIHF